MRTSKLKNRLRPTVLSLSLALLAGGCESDMFKQQNTAPPRVATAPAVRLNFRFEPDVPAPAGDIAKQAPDERNAAVQADFDDTRPQEVVDKMIASPDKKRVAVVYHKVTDYSSEYRIDMYSAEGKLLRKATSDTMAVHIPDSIVWSPDSSTLAFVAMIRLIAPAAEMAPPPAATPDPENPDAVPTPVPAAPTPAAPTGILTFRSEQIYTCNTDGAGTKALTENEGLIYFYYGWAPDSSMLVALAATVREWKYLDVTSAGKGEALVPQGRLRIIEKNGRERRLDDNLTAVRPVWSPDSAKVAAAFDTQIRIYDAVAINPTQAAIPLRNQLLISSQAYDRNQQRLNQTAGDANSDANSAPTPDQPLSTLPDEKLLVSYNPVVEIAWTAEDMIYLQTSYLKRMRNETDNVRSFARWHRLIFTAQPTVASNKPQ